jgi:pyruvate dehydrogenase E2 component (dihydrolipoamide acetyltransferase)
MPVPVTIPRLGWNMESGIFIEWLVADGDSVKPGDRLFRLEGEKSVEEIECFDAGALFIPPDAPKPGDSVPVGATIGFVLQHGEAKPIRAGSVSDGPAPVAHASGSLEQAPVAYASGSLDQPVASPSLRRMAREKGIDLAAVSGSGPGGRITERDLFPKPASPRARRLAKQHGIDITAICGSGKSGRIRERDIPIPQLAAPPRTVRTAIAARMMASRANTAPVTLTAQVDCVNLVNLRAQFKAVDASPPSFNDFFVKLAAAALEKHPQLAAQWTDAGIVPASSIDIGFAVDTDAGLLVPVIRDVPKLNLRQVATRSQELIVASKAGALASRDMSGGCFTITNLGSFGIDAFTPIINLPECAILGIGRIERRPVMEGEKITGREQVWLSLTFDHRIVDGAPAARFLQTLAQLIANPGPALLD